MDEILHQVVDSLSHYLQGFRHTRWLFEISSINSRNEDPDYVSYFNEGLRRLGDSAGWRLPMESCFCSCALALAQSMVYVLCHDGKREELGTWDL